MSRQVLRAYNYGPWRPIVASSKPPFSSLCKAYTPGPPTRGKFDEDKSMAGCGREILWSNLVLAM